MSHGKHSHHCPDFYGDGTLSEVFAIRANGVVDSRVINWQLCDRNKWVVSVIPKPIILILKGINTNEPE
jgi:hypothetical protein